MLEAEVQKHSNAAGLPLMVSSKTLLQAEALDIFLAKQNLDISATVALEASDDILVERSLCAQKGKLVVVQTIKMR